MAFLSRLTGSLGPGAALRQAVRLAEADRHAEAFALFAKAARAADPEAEFRVAQCYLAGRGVPPSREEGARWMRRAAEHGNAEAQAALAGLYLTGFASDDAGNGSQRLFEQAESGEPRFGPALELATKAANAGSAKGQALLGYILTVGPADMRDLEAAHAWYERSADGGCPEGSLGLALSLARRNKGPAEKARMAVELHRASQAGLPAAIYLLAVVNEHGIGTPRDLDAAARLYADAAGKGLASAQLRLGAALVEGTLGNRDVVEGRSWMRRAALSGDAEAAYALGMLYARDQPPDFAEAAAWYRQSADAGHQLAARELASLYLTGSGVAVDPEESRRLLRVAAEGGSHDARVDLANVVLEGADAARDSAEIPGWFEKAASTGDAVAAYNLGLCYAKGLGTAQDDAKAAQWIRRAADTVAEAQYMYGRMAQSGRGVPANQKEARLWFARAASAGVLEARVALAEMLINGNGGERMPDAAAQLFSQAAAAGHPGAMLALGVLNQTGDGVAENQEEAMKWFTAAAKRGNEDARAYLDSLARADQFRTSG